MIRLTAGALLTLTAGLITAPTATAIAATLVGLAVLIGGWASWNDDRAEARRRRIHRDLQARLRRHRAPGRPGGYPPPQHRTRHHPQTLQLTAVAVWGEPGDPINATELLPILEAA